MSLSVCAPTLAGVLAATAQLAVPVVTVYAPDPIAVEPKPSQSWDSGRLLVKRDGPTNLALNVYSVLEGTASNGVDYVTIPNWISVPAGVREVPISVTPIQDGVFEGSETATLRLVPSPMLPPVNYIIGSPSNAVVTIYDNPLTNQPPTVGIASPADGAMFVAPATISICADARDTDGYVTTVEYFANNISIGVKTNLCPLCLGPLNPFCLTWSNVPPGDHVLTAKATDDKGAMGWSSPVEIHVRPPPPPTVVNIVATDPEASEIPPVPPGLEMPQKIDPAIFKVWRDGNTNSPLTVYYTVSGTASNGVDYVKLPGTVTIPAGAFAANIEVLPIDDFLVEGTETVFVTLQSPVCIATYPPPLDCYQVGPSNQAAAYILDDDPLTNRPPFVRIVKPLDGQTFLPPTNVLIAADTVDLDGYVPKVEFFANNVKIGEQERHILVVPPPGQHNAFEFVWTNPPTGRHVLAARATDNQSAFGLSDPVVIWVVNTNLPPPPPLVTITAADSVASEGTNWYQWIDWPNTGAANLSGTNTATFVVHRNGPTNDALTVWYCIGGTASNGVDYVELPGVVTIPAGKLGAPIVIVPLDDNLPEKEETVVVRLLVPPNMASVIPPYIIGDPGRAAVIIVDNDQPRPLTGTLSDGCFHLVKPAAKGTWWRIECSQDMAHWFPICTIPVADGALHFVDPDADEAPCRFYRAVPDLPPPSE